MPGDFCQPVRRFREDALKAQHEQEVMRLLEGARQLLISRGFHCPDFSCLTDSFEAVSIERAERQALEPTQAAAFLLSAPSDPTIKQIISEQGGTFETPEYTYP